MLCVVCGGVGGGGGGDRDLTLSGPGVGADVDIQCYYASTIRHLFWRGVREGHG